MTGGEPGGGRGPGRGPRPVVDLPPPPRRSGRSSWIWLVVVAALVGVVAGCTDDGRATGRSGVSEPSDGSDRSTAEPVDPCLVVADAGAAGPVGEPGSSDVGEDVAVTVGSFDGLVPKPTRVTPGSGSFVVDGDVAIEVVDPVALAAACLLRDALAASTGVVVPVALRSGSGGGADEDAGRAGGATRDTGVRPIVFGPVGWPVDGSPGDPRPAEPVEGWPGGEAYRLLVTPERVAIAATGAPGFGWAAQTVVQTIPPVESDGSSTGPVALPVGEVVDVPRFAWRGVMIDVARHFFGPTELRRVVDLLAAYKLNVLHLHLTDDQGWRLAIDAYPELAEVGGANEVGGGPGGHLTRDEYGELVAYAARRGVTVVPEIDVPGHTNAALVARPELDCDPPAEPYTGMAVGFSSLCIGRPEVAAFVATVFGEVAGLTPGPFLHLGGDESHATEPADYDDFVADTLQVIRDLGKVPVGWEEVGRVGPGDGLVVQHWLDPVAAVRGVEAGAAVVLSPSSRLYFDMAYGSFAPDGNSWAGMIDTREVYDWDPVLELAGANGSAVAPTSVLGVEAPLWTELVETPDDLFRRLLPRLPALAEVGWSAQTDRSWDDFVARLGPHGRRWIAAGLAFTDDPGVPLAPGP